MYDAKITKSFPFIFTSIFTVVVVAVVVVDDNDDTRDSHDSCVKKHALSGIS